MGRRHLPANIIQTKLEKNVKVNIKTVINVRLKNINRVINEINRLTALVT